jgi:signal transduction histidine kinase
MSLRSRLLIAFAAVVLIPIALLAFGLRQEMTRRLAQEYQPRVDSVVEVIGGDLARESAGISRRLASLARALQDDNRFRLAAVAGVEQERNDLLDYAGTAMRLTGLSMLQIQDDEGRILSSGHFRNEHGRIEAELVPALRKAGDVALVTTRSADREFLALARVEPVVVSGRTFTIVGGVAVDRDFLTRLARDRSIVLSLTYPRGELSTADSRPDRTDSAVRRMEIPLVRSDAGVPPDVVAAALEVVQPLTPLQALLRSADSWFLFTALGTGAAALLLAFWVSSRISRPLSALADKAAVLDLDRLDVDFDAGTDEVGRLSSLLGDLAARLRTSTGRIREAERRATVGELARQINHDIKNGLIPLRNVMRHLEQVSRDDPAALPAIFAERRQTVDSSIVYLETLATSYQRLTPAVNRRACDLNALVTEVVRAAQGNPSVEFETDLTNVPAVEGDPVAFRRILENLIANAVDSLESPGRVTVSTRTVARDGDSPYARVSVVDTGRGMSTDETKRIFEDFYTTKDGGTGLGLSIVRRLVMDLRGTISVDSVPGQGTRMVVDIPGTGSRRTV